MASLIYKPPAGSESRGTLEVRVDGIIYTFAAGVAQDVPIEHYAALQTAIAAAMASATGTAGPSDL